MRQKADTLLAPVPETRGQSMVRWGIPILAIGLAALLLLLLVVMGVSETQVAKPVMLPVGGNARFASNPELMIVARHAAAIAEHADAAILAANPELMAVRRYAAPRSAGGQSCGRQRGADGHPLPHGSRSEESQPLRCQPRVDGCPPLQPSAGGAR